MKRLLFCVTCLALLAFSGTPATGQELFPNAPNLLSPEGRNKLKPTTFNFLKVSNNARVAGMGDAFTAVADGIDGMIWNSAGIASVEKFAYSLNYTSWLVNSEFFSGALAFNTGYGVLGVSLVTFNLPTMKETTTLEPDGTGRTIDTGDMALGVVYAKQLTDKLSAGATVRFVQSKLGDETLSAMSFNVNTLMYTGYRSLRVGMNMKNLGGEQEIVSQKSEMPLVFNLGSAMEVYGELGDPVSMTAAFEGAYFTDRNQRWNLGGELWVQNLVALRAGYKFKYDEETWSIGGGLRADFDGRKIQVDASYTNFGDLLDAPLRLSLSGSF
jgi:hypothetical protein